MIEFRRGNLLEADADALVNTVNCVGVMGKGIALQFKQAHPDNYRAYEKACKQDHVRLGTMFVHATGSMTPPRFIINFPTKKHWRAASRLDDIRSGLDDLIRVIEAHAITSVAVPPLGCGNGGLDWADVYPLIEAAFAAVPDVRVFLYAPQPAPPPETMPVATRRLRMTRSRALMVLLLDRYRGPGYRLAKLEVQKLAYFLQEAGEGLKLKFVGHTFGPYADDLNHVFRNMEGHMTRGFGDGSAEASIAPMPGVVDEAERFIRDDAEAKQRLDRVATLINGFEDPYGLELLATTHWVAKEDPAARADVTAAIAAVHGWSERKRATFRAEHVAIVWKQLQQQNWLDAA